MRLTRLWELGFDDSCYDEDTDSWRVRCSQCEAMCINGVPCHESGCPNEKHECSGCGNIVLKGVKYCEECA